MCRKKITFKKGMLYEDIRSQLRPFDLVLFRGSSVFSKSISLSQKFGNKFANSGEFTHTGVVVTSEILERDNILPGKLYILESTVGGVKDVNGNTIFGVQIRDLDAVIDAYDKSSKTAIACGKLMRNPMDTMPIGEVKQRFVDFYNEVDGKKYDANPFSLLSAIIPCMRKHRDTIEEFVGTRDWYFCSEIVALLYKKFAIYPNSVNEKDVTPRDFVFPWADTDVMPKIINELIYMTTPLHYSGDGELARIAL
jgi:hypothetical protein